MDRYNKANGADAPPAAPPAADHPYYTSGDPENDIPATTPGPWWFHMITESMRNVILAAGLTPQWNVLTLFLDAIRVLIAGGDYKASCRVASTANINLAAPGANIDGVAMVAGDRVLLKNQAAGAQNGIWIWNGAAAALTRAPDADAGSELNSGAIIPIEQGTINADTNWQLTTDGVITIGVTALVFDAFTVFSATETVAGKAEIATQAETDAGTDDARIVTSLKMKNGFAINLAANGYIKFPSWLGGFILQWISSDVTISAEGDQLINLPMTFPNAGLGAFGIMRISTANTSQNSFMHFRALSTSQFTFYHQVAPNSPSVTSDGYRGFVWGY